MKSSPAAFAAAEPGMQSVPAGRRKDSSRHVLIHSLAFITGRLADFDFGGGPFAFGRLALRIGIASAVAILAASINPAPAHAEPAGYITVARDVPVHDAFRPGDVGQPTNVPTAREDIVIANTNTIGRIPQSLSDTALGSVGGQPAGRIEAAKPLDGAVAASMIAAPGSALGRGMALPATNAASAGIGTAIAGGTSAIGAAISGLAGFK